MSMSWFVPIIGLLRTSLSDAILTSRFSKSFGMQILFPPLWEACDELLEAILFLLSADFFVRYISKEEVVQRVPPSGTS